MINQYKNIDKILNSSSSLSAERFDLNVRSRFKYVNIDHPVSRNVEFNGIDSNIELHVYANDTWISANHTVKVTPTVTNNILDSVTGQIINFNSTPITIDLYKELESLKITGGRFRFVVNFHKNLIGNYNTQYLAIDQISDDRTELKLTAISSDNQIYKQQLQKFIKTISAGKQTANILNGNPNTYKSYLLNFSRNKTVLFVNSVVVGNYVYVKLLDPLPDDIDINFKCWIVEEQKPSYIDSVSISPYIATKQYNNLAMPNWYANANYNTSTSTGLKNWNDLLGSSVQTSQQIIDTYFSGSGAKLNIDYRDFNNFVFYSSAEERVKNFKYKLELLEYYTKQSSSISTISGSIAINNIADYELRKSNLIGGFDAFEKFLYYESSSRLTTYDIPLESANVANLTGSYITPIPNASTTSSLFINWYNGLLSSASYYDSFNLNALSKAIPEYVLINAANGDLELFVNMLGHHYDVIYTYINHMSKIHTREENPSLGMPNELLYSVAKQFGWNLTNGNQSDDIWKYVFGTDQSGTPLTGSNSVNGTSMGGQDMTYSVWRRIVNNLPLLLKSKGTSRSIKALLSCYGIPQSVITIKEYGGPRIDRAPVYEKLNFDYALDLINNTAGTVNVNYSQSLNAVELRFRTNNVVSNPLLPSTMNLYSIGNNAVTIDYTSGTLGKIRINGTASANIEMFDGGWINTVLRTSGSRLEVVAKRSKYGKIVATVSASAVASFPGSGSLTLGSTSTGAVRLQGQLQELRLWSSSLSDAAFNNHTKAPAAYNGNIDSYDELFFRLPLTQKINHSITSSLIGVQPRLSPVSASFTGWSSTQPYDSLEETYYYDGISLGAGTFDDNKIRIESNELVGNLDVKTRAEQSQYDTAPLDSNKLGVYFSPQTMINEDIISQLGFTSLDDYIGDPGETEEKSYPRLIQQATNYWKKYTDKNDVNAYIKIFTLFDLSFFKQLEQLLPARVKPVTGILIQPNILERSKDTVLPNVSYSELSLETDLNNIKPTLASDITLYTASISDYLDLSSEYTNNYSTQLSSSILEILSDYNKTYSAEFSVLLTASAESNKTYSAGFSVVPTASAESNKTYSGGLTGIPTASAHYTNYSAELSGNILQISGYDNEHLFGFLTSSADKRYNGTVYIHDYLYRSGSTYVTGSTPYWMSEAVMPNYSKPTLSSTRFYKKPISTYGIYGEAIYGYNTYYTPYTPAELQDYLSTSLFNLWYDGSKMSSPGFNIRSTDTVDGGPVVEWNDIKGNQLIYKPTNRGPYRPDIYSADFGVISTDILPDINPL